MSGGGGQARRKAGFFKFYTIEARHPMGYDAGIPGQGIIIHEIDPVREIILNDRVAQVVDVDGNGDPNDAGAMWTPDEAFIGAANGINVTISSATTTGFIVTIEYYPNLAKKIYLPLVLKGL